MVRDETENLVYMLLSSLQTQHAVANEEALISGWHLALADVPYEAGQVAVAVYLRTGKWFPAPSEIRKLVADSVIGLPDAGDAWRMVQRHLRDTHGPFGSANPAFAGPEPVRQAVQALGGWNVLRMSEEPARDREAFGRAYRIYVERAYRDADLSLPERAGEDAPALAGSLDGRPWWSAGEEGTS